jgi:hypothetical protein
VARRTGPRATEFGSTSVLHSLPHLAHHKVINGSSGLFLKNLGVPLARYAVFWSAVWLVQWWLAPTWLVGSRSGLSTLLQALPGAIVGLLALIFASFYVLGQQSANVYGSRAVTVLTVDPQVFNLLARALLLAIVPLLLGGQVPDTGHPSDAVTSAVATVTLAAAVLIPSAANLLMALLGAYTAPRSFMLRTTANVDQYLKAGALDLVVFRVTALGEMVRSAVRRGEGVAVTAGLEGLELLQDAYIEAAAERPEVRFLRSENRGDPGEGWLGIEMAESLVRTGDEVLRTEAVEHDLNAVADTLERVTAAAIKAHQSVEARALIEALARLGTSSHQVRPQAINLWPQSAPTLGRVERIAEEEGQRDLAASALAAWALVVAYPVYHFEYPHPLFFPSVDELGPEPPWDTAREIIGSEEFQRAWANKLEEISPVHPGGTAVALESMRLAAEHRGVALPEWPTLQVRPLDAGKNHAPA